MTLSGENFIIESAIQKRKKMGSIYSIPIVFLLGNSMKTIIAIGALGGSGTRVIAQLLIDAGIYMGDDLNVSNDNLIFTRLFKNPSWYDNASKKEFAERLDVFKNYMEQDRLDFNRASILIKASMTNPIFREDKKLAMNIIRKIYRPQKERCIWGWKEPNTHIYITEISNYFPNLRYVHLVRHGLDMAFSNNKQQLNNWGNKYGIYLNGKEAEDEIVYKQMEYWVRSTKDAINNGQKLGDRFLLFNHSTLCRQPIEQVDRLIQFLGLDLKKDQLDGLYKLPKEPATMGRFKKYDLQILDKRQIDFVEDLGFDL